MAVSGIEYQYKCNAESIGKTEEHTVYCPKCGAVSGHLDVRYVAQKTGKNSNREEVLTLNHDVKMVRKSSVWGQRDDGYIELDNDLYLLVRNGACGYTNPTECRDCAIKHNETIETIENQNRLIVARRNLIKEQAEDVENKILSIKKQKQADEREAKLEEIMATFAQIGDRRYNGVVGLYDLGTDGYRIYFIDGTMILTKETVITNFVLSASTKKKKLKAF
jgi:uncharacterized Zn finger protein (UPF0148 family)